MQPKSRAVFGSALFGDIARDDLLGTESGKIYELNVLNTMINEYVKAQSEGVSGEQSSSCGGSFITRTDENRDLRVSVLPTVVTVAVACLVYWGIDRKIHSKNR